MAQHNENFLAACVQLRSGIDRRRNTSAALDLIAEAASKGAKLIATPEMTNIVDRDADRMFAHLEEEEGLEEIGAFAEAARAHGAWLLIGSMAVKIGQRRAVNRSFLFSPKGELAARYDKLHMFDVQLPKGETWKESNVYQPGESAVIVETPLATLGLSICYDVRFPHLYRALARAGNIKAVTKKIRDPTGPTDLQALVAAISDAAAGTPAPHAPWLPALGELIALEDLEPVSADLAVPPAIGLRDDPDGQSQHPHRIDLPTCGSLLVVGASGSGKTTTLRSLAVSLATRHSPDDLHLYALDFASRGLGVLAELPHCGAVIPGTDQERVVRLLSTIERESDGSTEPPDASRRSATALSTPGKPPLAAI